MKPVTVAAFNSLAEAEPLQERLVMAGIAAEIHGESQLETLLDYSRASAGVRIEVPRQSFEAALQLIYDWNTNGKPEATIVGRQSTIDPGSKDQTSMNSPSVPR